MTSLPRVAVCLAVLLVAACATPQVRNVDVTEQDQGRTVDLAVGDTLTVRLSGNPSTGFNWEVASVPTSVLQQLGDRGQQPTTTGVVGASETIIFRFRAAAAGEARLSFIYRRSFETVPPARAFDVGVRVR